MYLIYSSIDIDLMLLNNQASFKHTLGPLDQDMATNTATTSFFGESRDKDNGICIQGGVNGKLAI